MPKDVLEIKTFESGNIYNADDRDIPDDAAVYSENIDPYGQGGSLMAIQADAATIKTDVDTTRMKLINDNGTYRLVYVDKSDYDIKKVDDVYGSPSSPTVLEAGTFGTSTSIAALQTNNKEVHMGLGSTRDAKWVGTIPHGQFGGSAPSGLQCVKAELTSPTSFPNMHKVVSDGTHAYGIEFGGFRLYKFKLSDHSFVESKIIESGTLPELSAIALASDNNLWVFDVASKNYVGSAPSTLGSWMKVNASTLDVISSGTLNIAKTTSDMVGYGYKGVGVTTTASDKPIVTDIIEIGNYLWFGLGCGITGQAQDLRAKVHLCNQETSHFITGATVIAGMRHFTMQDGGTDNAGEWELGGSGNVTAIIPPICLIDPKHGSNEYCGIVMEWYKQDGSTSMHNASGLGLRDTSNASSISQLGLAIMSMKIDDNGGNDYPDNWASYFAGGDIETSNGRVFGIFQSSNKSKMMFGLRNNSTSTLSDYEFMDSYDHDTTYTDHQLGNRTTNTGEDINNGVVYFKNNSSNYDYYIWSGDGVGRLMSLINASNHSTSNFTPRLENAVELVLLENTLTSAIHTNNKKYYYKVSFLYDGYQESPLSDFTSIVSTGKQIAININVHSVVSVNARVSHVNIYMAEGENNSLSPTGFYRHVTSVKLDADWTSVSDNAANPDWGSYYTRLYTHATGLSASYEARTGISEVLKNTIPKYGLSAQLNNFLYVADCSHPEIDDASNYIFKSRPFNYNQFNYIIDFMILPDKPVALEVFNGRLYAFTTNKTYVINPDGLYIEDTLEGIGCRNQNGVVVSEIGMCWIDFNSIYLHDGKVVRDIGSKIKKAHQIDDTYNVYSTLEKLCAFSSSDYEGDIVIAYDSYRKAFCFFYTYYYNTVTTFDQTGCSFDTTTESINHPVNANIVLGLAVSGTGMPSNAVISDIVEGNNTRFEITPFPTAEGTNVTLTFTSTIPTYVPQCLVYTVPKNRWDVWNRTNSNTTTTFNTHSALNGKNGELLVSDTTGLLKPFDPLNSTRLDNFKWYSKKFTMGESTSDKKIYKVEILSEDSSPTITVNTAENSNVYSALSIKRTARHAQIKLEVAGDATATIDALRLVFRRLKRTKAMS